MAIIISIFNEFTWGKLVVAVIFIFISICAYSVLSDIPSDTEIDNFINEVAQIRLTQSFDKLNINKDDTISEPLCIFGIANSENLCSKIGKDGVVRFNPQKLTIVHFTKSQLLINEASLDLLNPEQNIGATNEFFYKDISSVSIYDQDDMKRFAIRVHGQQECDMAIATKEITNPRALEIAEKAVNTIRQTLRERKTE